MIRELKELGFNEYESRVYITLIKNGTQTGSQLSKLSKVPQSKIYETLYKLHEKNFVNIFNTSPKKFKATNPETALRFLFKLKRKKLDELENEIKLSLPAVKKDKTTDELIYAYKGFERALEIFINNCNNSKKTIKFMFTFEVMPHSFLKALKRAINKGVEVKLIATKNKSEQIARINTTQKLGIKVRYYPVKELRLGIFDSQMATQTLVNRKNTKDRTVVDIRSKGLSKSLEHYFNHI